MKPYRRKIIRRRLSETAIIADLSKQAKVQNNRWSWGYRYVDGRKDKKQDSSLFKYGKFGKSRNIRENRSDPRLGPNGKYRVYRYSTQHKKKMWPSYAKKYKK